MVRPLQVAEAPAPATRAAEAARSDQRDFLVLAAITAAAVALWFAPMTIAPRAQHALAIGAFMILAWVTQVLDLGVAGILGCFLFWALRVSRFEVAFSGFADTTAWFLFGAVCFGLMASKSGLARRLAYLVMRGFGTSYPRLLLGLIVSDFLLTPIVPSGIARVAIMASIAIGIIEAFGVDRRSNVARGMFVILVYQATIFDKMVIAGAASITAQGAIQKFGLVHVSWGQWFLAYLPCDILVMLIAWRIALWLYPPEPNALSGADVFLRRELRGMGGWSAIEVRSAILLTIAIGFWVTDRFHGIPAPMIGIATGLAALLPRIGVLDSEDVRKVNYLPIFFVAAAVSLSSVLAETKALDVITDVVFSFVTPHITSVWGPMVLYWAAFVYHIVIGNEIAMLSTSIPILMNHALQHGLDPLPLGMMWTFGAGPKLFMYESGVLVVGYSYGYFSATDLFKVGALLSIVTAIILFFLVPIYWPLIGNGR